MKKYIVSIVIAIIATALLTHITEATCIVYFTGIGCPHCAKTDPVIFKETINKYNLTILEYEIYQTRENGKVMYDYSTTYGRDWYGIPLVIFDKNNYIIGDTPILNNIENEIKIVGNNKCLLINNSSYISDIDLNQLPGKPKIWVKDRVLIKGSSYLNSSIARQLIFSKDPTTVLQNLNLTPANPCVPYSGGEVCFQHGVKFNKDWIFVWNGKSINISPTNLPTNINNIDHGEEHEIETTKGKNEMNLTLGKVVSLAAVDAVNPCALAVLILMLVAIMSYNPRKKYKVLLAGLAFSFSVFVMYFFYGLIIIKFFKIISQLVIAKIYIYKALAAFAIVLGLLNIKDSVKYKPGGLLREMPMSWRPKVKKIISGITSPLGACFVGFFVTVFLLPCTMGPYVITGGILSTLDFVKVIPWLLLYNLIFISPMLGITLLIYIGYTTVEKVSGWKDRNIRYLHAVAGVIMFILGVLMITGII